MKKAYIMVYWWWYKLVYKYKDSDEYVWAEVNTNVDAKEFHSSHAIVSSNNIYNVKNDKRLWD